MVDDLKELRAAANNVEYARMRACVEGLAGWEHRVIRNAADRIEKLEAALQRAAEAMTCRRDDDAHYCPNCDNSLYAARDDARATLSDSSEIVSSRAHPSDRAGRASPQAPSGLDHTATIPCADRVVGYRRGQCRNDERALTHTYAMMADGELWPMCGYGWNRSDGEAFSIFRSQPGTEGACKLCRKNVAAKKPPIFDGFAHKTRWL